VSVTYAAVLDVSEDSVLFLSGVLHAERVRVGTRAGTRALSTYKQAVLVLRWLFDDTRMSQLARDNAIGVSTAYDYRDEAIAVLADRKPSLRGALLAAKAAGHTHVLLDGTLISTDRICTPGCDPRGGPVVVGEAPPPRRQHPGRLRPRRLAVVDLRGAPGREHDTTAARADPELLAQITAWVDDGQLGLADLGYEGEAELLRIPIKKPAHGDLTADQQAYNAVHGALRCLGERANSLLKTSFKALRGGSFRTRASTGPRSGPARPGAGPLPCRARPRRSSQSLSPTSTPSSCAPSTC
jgi:hypothetical protein